MVKQNEFHLFHQLFDLKKIPENWITFIFKHESFLDKSDVKQNELVKARMMQFFTDFQNRSMMENSLELKQLEKKNKKELLLLSNVDEYLKLLLLKAITQFEI